MLTNRYFSNQQMLTTLSMHSRHRDRLQGVRLQSDNTPCGTVTGHEMLPHAVLSVRILPTRKENQ